MLRLYWNCSDGRVVVCNVSSKEKLKNRIDALDIPDKAAKNVGLKTVDELKKEIGKHFYEIFQVQ